MIYTGPDDQNLPEDVKALSEQEIAVYIMINNAYLTHPKTSAAADSDTKAHAIGLFWVQKWQNYELPARGG